MMRDTRRRSPEGSRRRRAERRQSREQLAGTTPTTSVGQTYYHYDDQIGMPFSQPGVAPNTGSRHYDPPTTTTTTARMRKHSTASSSSSSSSSSSTSSSLLNISRPDSRFTLRSFFTRRRSSRRLRKRASFRAKNGSSSSVDSDLAYGRGYIPKTTRSWTQPSAAGVEAGRSSIRHSQTDAEILDIGRRLQAYARSENDGHTERSGRMAAAATVHDDFRRTKTGDRSQRRGVGSSRLHGVEEDSGWESASDDSSRESSSTDDVDMGLAYGASQTYLPPRQTQMDPERRAKTTQTLPLEAIRPLDRTSSAAGTSMFGPQNSLRGLVTQLGYRPAWHAQAVPQPSSAPAETRPMQRVYPVPTSDPGRFDALSSTVVSYSAQDAPDSTAYSRPAPVPIQAPTPRVPVSTRVLEEQRVRDERRDSKDSIRRKSEGNREFAAGAAAVAGIAAAAVGAAMLSDRKEKRERDEREAREKERERDERCIEEERKRTLGELDKKIDSHETKKGGRESDSRLGSRSDDMRESKRDSARATPIVMYDEGTFGKRSEKTEDEKWDPERDRGQLSSSVNKGTPEERKEQRRRERESTQQMLRELRKEISRERALAEARKGKAPEASDTSNKREPPGSSRPSSSYVDPFQYQVGADAFSTPTYDTPRRPLTPIIVEAEPKFLDEDRSKRMSRRDSFEMEMEHARHVAEEPRHSTISEEAAMSPTAAIVGHEQDRHRDAEPVRDPQEEANRVYRERMMARRLAQEQVREHGDSPTASVVDKYEKDQSHQGGHIVRVVTPPAVDPTNKFDSPNADVRIDNVIMPHDLVFYLVPKSRTGSTAAPQTWMARDPSCERERPLLNLVLPTPVATPSPEKQRGQGKFSEPEPEPEPEAEAQGQPEQPQVAEMETEKDETTPPTPKSVSWGENETRHFVSEGAGRAWYRERDQDSAPRDESAPRISPFGMAAAAVVGAATAGVAASHNEPEGEKEVAFETVQHDGEPCSNVDEEIVDRTDVPPSSRPWGIIQDMDDDEPPNVGPKPANAHISQMPGAFDDDVDFVATLAAGLQSTGFDPRTVTEDPNYYRRDSPPGSNEPEEVPVFKVVYQQPFAQTVSDLGFYDTQPATRVAEPGFVIGEVSETPTPVSEKPAPLEDVDEVLMETSREYGDNDKKRQSLSGSEAGGTLVAETGADDTWAGNMQAADLQDAKASIIVEECQQIDPSPIPEDTPSKKKLSKKELRKKEKAAKAKQGGDSAAGESAETTKAELDAVPADASEDEWMERASKKKKGKKKAKSALWQDALETLPADETSRVTVPVDNVGASIEDSKQHSFLGNAGTLGAGVGLAGVAASLVAAQASRSNAKQASLEEHGEEEKEKEDVSLPRDARDVAGDGEFQGNAPFWLVDDIRRFIPSRTDRTRNVSRDSQVIDPEVLVHRVVKPAVDPQYGDLLPLPPSEPGSPRGGAADVADFDHLPSLPDSRPGTPLGERRSSLGSGGGGTPILRTPSTKIHVRRRSGVDGAVKSPSHTAVPLQFRLGPQRGSAGPSSPATPPPSSSTPRFAWPPMVQTPRTPTPGGSAAKARAARPTSWDSSREIKPLYLLEKASASSLVAAYDEACEKELPASRGSPALEKGDDCFSPSTNLPAEQPPLPDRTDTSFADEPMSPQAPFDPVSKDRSSYLLQQTPTPIKKLVSGEYRHVPHDEFPSQRLVKSKGGLSSDDVLEAALLAASGVGMADLVAVALRGDHEKALEEGEEEQQKLDVVPEGSAEHVPQSDVFDKVSPKGNDWESRDFPEPDFGYVNAVRGKKGKGGSKNRNIDSWTEPSSQSQPEPGESTQRTSEPPATSKKQGKKKKKGKQAAYQDGFEVENTTSGVVQTRPALNKSSANIEDAILPAHHESSAITPATTDAECMLPPGSDQAELDLSSTRNLVAEPATEERPASHHDVFNALHEPDASSAAATAQERNPETTHTESPSNLPATEALSSEVLELRDLPRELTDADAPAVQSSVSEDEVTQKPEAGIREPEPEANFQEPEQAAQKLEQTVGEREKKGYLPSALALLPALPSVGSFFRLGKEPTREVEQSVLPDSSRDLSKGVQPLPDMLASTTSAPPTVEPGDEQGGPIEAGTALQDTLTLMPSNDSVYGTTLCEPHTAVSRSIDQIQEQPTGNLHSSSGIGDDVTPVQNVEIGELPVENSEDPPTVFEEAQEVANEAPEPVDWPDASVAPEPRNTAETDLTDTGNKEVSPGDVSRTDISTDPQVVDEAPLSPGKTADDAAGDDIMSEPPGKKRKDKEKQRATLDASNFPLEEADKNDPALTETDATPDVQPEEQATHGSQALVEEGALSSEKAVDDTVEDDPWSGPSGKKRKKAKKKKQPTRDVDVPVEEPASAIHDVKVINTSEPVEILLPDEQGQEEHVREPELDDGESLHAEIASEQTASRLPTSEEDCPLSPAQLDDSQPDASSALPTGLARHSTATDSQMEPISDPEPEPEGHSWPTNKKGKKGQKKWGSVVDWEGSNDSRGLPAESEQSMEAASSKPHLEDVVAFATKKSKKDKKKKRQSSAFAEPLEEEQQPDSKLEHELAMDASKGKLAEDAEAGAGESEMPEASGPSEGGESSFSKVQDGLDTESATVEHLPNVLLSDSVLSTESPAQEVKLDESEPSESMHIGDHSGTPAEAALSGPGAEISDSPKVSQIEETELSNAPSITGPAAVDSVENDAANLATSPTQRGSSTSGTCLGETSTAEQGPLKVKNEGDDWSAGEEDSNHRKHTSEIHDEAESPIVVHADVEQPSVEFQKDTGVVALDVTESGGSLVPAPGSNPADDEKSPSTISSKGHQATEPDILPEADLLPVAPSAEDSETIERELPRQMDLLQPEPHDDSQTQLARDSPQVKATLTGDAAHELQDGPNVHETPEDRDTSPAEVEDIAVHSDQSVREGNFSGDADPKTGQKESPGADQKALQVPETNACRTDELDRQMSGWESPEPSQVPDSFMDSVEYITPLTTQESALKADESEVPSPASASFPEEAESRSGDKELQVRELGASLEPILEEEEAEPVFTVMKKSKKDKRKAKKATQATSAKDQRWQPSMQQPDIFSQEAEQSKNSEPEVAKPEASLETSLVEDFEPVKKSKKTRDGKKAEQSKSDDAWSLQPTTMQESEITTHEAENKEKEAEKVEASLDRSGPEESELIKSKEDKMDETASSLTLNDNDWSSQQPTQSKDLAKEVNVDPESLLNSEDTEAHNVALPFDQVVEPGDRPEKNVPAPLETEADFDIRDQSKDREDISRSLETASHPAGQVPQTDIHSLQEAEAEDIFPITRKKSKKDKKRKTARQPDSQLDSGTATPFKPEETQVPVAPAFEPAESSAMMTAELAENPVDSSDSQEVTAIIAKDAESDEWATSTSSKKLAEESAALEAFDDARSAEVTAAHVAEETSGPVPPLGMSTLEVAEAAKHISSEDKVPAVVAPEQPSVESEQVELPDTQTLHVSDDQEKAYREPEPSVDMQEGDVEISEPELAGCVSSVVEDATSEMPVAGVEISTENSEPVHSDTLSMKETEPEGPPRDVPAEGERDRPGKKSKADKKRKKRVNWELGLETSASEVGKEKTAEASPGLEARTEPMKTKQEEAQPEALETTTRQTTSSPRDAEPEDDGTAWASPVGKKSKKNKRKSKQLDWFANPASGSQRPALHEEEARSSQQADPILDVSPAADKEKDVEILTQVLNEPTVVDETTIVDEPTIVEEAGDVDETATATTVQEEHSEPSGQTRSLEDTGDMLRLDSAQPDEQEAIPEIESSEWLAQSREGKNSIPGQTSGTTTPAREEHSHMLDPPVDADDAATVDVGALIESAELSGVQEQVEGAPAAAVEHVQELSHDVLNSHADAAPIGPVDMRPAQESSSISHDKPFDYSEHRKKVKTRNMDSFMVPEQDLEAVIPGRHLEDVDEHHSEEEHAEPLQGESARDIAASYLESTHKENPVAPNDEHEGHQEKAKDKEQHGTSTDEVVVAGAAVGGVAWLADKFGGSKKSKKGGKKKMATDQWTRREEDEELLENADGQHDKNPPRQDSDSIPETYPEEREPPAQRASLVPEDISGEEASSRREPEQMESATHVPDEHGRLRESLVGVASRSVSSLDPVQEEEQETEDASRRSSPSHGSRQLSSTPDINRDSGFVAASPRSIPWTQVHEEANRDSGVHLRHSIEDFPKGEASQKELVVKKRTSSPSDACIAPLVSVPRSVSDSSPHANDLVARRSASNTSLARRTPDLLNLRPETPGSTRSQASTASLRRVKRAGGDGDLRSVSRSQREAADETGSPTDLATAFLDLAARTSQNSSSIVANEGRVRAKGSGMADVLDGYGEGRMGSPRSPTRPHSMRRRQSMQVLELESKVEQLVSENRTLETSLKQKAAMALAERDSEIEKLKNDLEKAQETIDRLQQMFEGQQSSVTAVALKHSEDRRQHEEQLASADRELQAKNAEVVQLRSQLEQLQADMVVNDDADFLDAYSIDHFDRRFQQLCTHVQQWVLRFSKFSDMHACRLTSELNDDKLVDRLDNALLDGSNVDTYLRDRVRRRDIFMSMVTTMIWELVFARYLFGMDREQRQKLKALEKQLLEVGPVHAVRQWRAVTLTLLSRRPAFARQRDLDTEAVVHAVLDPLTRILPPPHDREPLLRSQLRKVMGEAVQLAVDMRCQRAEYQMLPPLQPEYDEAGDLTERVFFNAALMQDRATGTDAPDTPPTSGEELEAHGATIRVVLFPLVVRKGGDDGRGDDEVVVCPAQVLLASQRDGSSSAADSRRSGARVVTSSDDAGGASLYRGSGGHGPNASTVSVTMTDAPAGAF